jgi:hypothetical protein
VIEENLCGTVLRMVKRADKEEKESTGRNTTSIELSPEAMQAIDAYVDKRGGRGMKKFVLSKLALWFAMQPEPVKSAVIGWMDEGIEIAYADLLFKLSREARERANRKPSENGGSKT